MFIIHDIEDNFFMNTEGRIINIFEYAHPNDIFLYRKDPGHSVFYKKDNPNVMCEIITREEWCCEPIYDDLFDGMCGGRWCRFSTSEKAGQQQICEACYGRG